MNAVQPTVFNEAQLYLLGVFSHINNEEELNDIKDLICHTATNLPPSRSPLNKGFFSDWWQYCRYFFKKYFFNTRCVLHF